VNPGRSIESLAVSAIVGALALASEEALAADTYAAIAYSTENGYYGYANRYPTRDQAEERALQECGESCEVVMWVRNECAVLVTGKSNGYGANRSADEDEAVAGAIAQCELYTTDCTNIVMTCSAY
jgi:serine/threonine-protein kinase